MRNQARKRLRLLTLIVDTYVPESRKSYYKDLIIKYCKIVSDLIDQRGPKWTVLYLKRVRLCFTRYLCGQPVFKCDGVGLTSAGVPKKFKFLLPSDTDYDQWDIRILLTMLACLRGYRGPVEVDMSPITDISKADFTTLLWKDHVKICRDLNIRRHECIYKSYHLSTKSGPVGQALYSSYSDLLTLSPTMRASIEALGGKLLSERIDGLLCPRPYWKSLADLWDEMYNCKRNYHLRKLVPFAEKECKTRIIAIFDYWSQTALRPLHKTVNRMLRDISEDCTFDQGSFIHKLPETGPYYSFDLTNATDRMPIFLQRRIVSSIIGEERSRAWADLMVGTPFMLSGKKELFKYMAGQPMGAYSSWPVMALTHHYIVRLAMIRAGIKYRKGLYVLLGDDIVIANEEIALSYQLLMKTFDIPISEMKSHISDRMYEFAKRWVYKGVEVTPFSIHGLEETWSRYSYLQNFLENQNQHGWNLAAGDTRDFIKTLYSINKRPAQAGRVYKLYRVFSAILGFQSDLETASSRLLEVMNDEWKTHFDSSETGLISETFKQVAANRLEQDLQVYDAGVAHIINDINERVAKIPGGLDAQSIRNDLRNYSPIHLVINKRIDRSTEALCLMWCETDDAPVDRIQLIRELAKCEVSKEIFTLRSFRRVLSAYSGYVKPVITKLLELAKLADRKVPE